MRLVRLAAVSVAVLGAAACSPAKPAPAGAGPLMLTMESSNGSVAPPYAYRWTLTVRPSGGTLEWRTFARDESPVWRESFAVSAQGLAAVRAAISAAGVPGRTWQPAEPMMGASSNSLSGAVDGQPVKIGTVLSPEDEQAVAPVYAAMRALVPDSTWASLRARQAAFVKAHGG
jgi:hypothetical protein